jgi:hypothetical protein
VKKQRLHSSQLENSFSKKLVNFIVLNGISMKIKMIFLLVFLLAACNTTNTNQEIIRLDQSEPSKTPTSPQSSGVSPLSDVEATKLMFQLSQSSGSSLQDTVERILTTNDKRFIAVFIELLRANQLSLLPGANFNTPIEALEYLSGESFGGDWAAWIEWYGKTDYKPPPGFTGWKGELLGRIDPDFANFLQDDFPSTIRTEEILWGGVVVDGIPALDNATMIPAAEADYLEMEEPVFGISINGDHRAYPLRILDWHEMANDVVGGVPVSLAYCTLCGAGIAFDGRASNGETYTFGSSGFLFRSNKLMYDRQTRTLWNQLTGEPVLGELVGFDVKLNLLPVVVTTWESWLTQHPETVVLDFDTGYNRPYVPGAAYGDYFAYHDTMFPVWQRSDRLPTKDRVYALQIDGIPKAYPMDVLVEEQVINDTIGQTSIVLVAARGDITVDGVNQRVGNVAYNAGAEVRAYDRGDKVFAPGPNSDLVVDTTGHTWQITEEALIGPDGVQAPRIGGHLAYWFGWFSFFPMTLIYEQP